MSNIIRLQVPMSKTLKVQGVNKAKKLGFTSLQEVVRVFITGFINDKVVPTFENRDTLSPTAEKRYADMIDKHRMDRRSGKIRKFRTSKSALKYLNGDE